MSNKNKYTNRLIHEKSPYLQQHAHHPVDWFPWGDEAFEKAQKERKPILLSIGYSTCHWCHVMARESFADEATASYLNTHYVSIKVDREERPDIDSVYMKVCQMLTGQGGWPMTIFMTPDKVPFYAGTYFPKEKKANLPGFLDLLQFLKEKYQETPDQIKQVTDYVTQALNQTTQQRGQQRVTKKAIPDTYHELEQRFDVENGGFGETPKFPQAQNLLFLLRYYRARGEKKALEMVEYTLKQMASGGIYDQIGFGFSRYTVDNQWLIPHFEKMLYDQALLTIVYVEAYQVTGNPFYKQIGEEVLSFVIQEMYDEGNAFYSAIDAESEGVEGNYYVWDKSDIMAILGNEVGDIYTALYRVNEVGHFHGKNILHRRREVTFESVASQHKLSIEELKDTVEKAGQSLLHARKKRVHPHVDDKVLTSWNSLMATALAMAGRVFQEDKYTEIAKKTILFIEEKLMIDGRLMARYRDNETKHKAYLDDYAYLLWAYLELYEATSAIDYLKKGKKHSNQMIDLFWDETEGGFFFSGKDGEKMIADDKEIYDRSLPSGNSVAAVMFARLEKLTGDTAYATIVQDMYTVFFKDISRQPSAASFFMQSLLLTEHATTEVILLGKASHPAIQSFIQEVQQHFLPNVHLVVAESSQALHTVTSFSKHITDREQPTAWICRDFTCEEPTHDLDAALKRILGN